MTDRGSLDFDTKSKDGAHRLTKKASVTNDLPFRRSEMLRSLRHYLQAESQAHNTVDSIEESGVEREIAQKSSSKGRERAIAGRTLELFQRQRSGNILGTG